MISKEQASSRKNGIKFDLIKTVISLDKAQKPGSGTHYESLLQQRQSGKCVVRKRDENNDSPFDDEGQYDIQKVLGAGAEDEADLDGMSISNFSKRYTSRQSTALGHTQQRDI